MRVKDLMARTPYFCYLHENLGAATERMWKGNCGFLPVLDPESNVRGVLTDRDIAIALGTRNLRAGELTVREVTQGSVVSCGPEDDIHVALQTMREGRVRRLVVIDPGGKLAGVISMDDIVLHAEPARFGREPELTADEAIRTFRTIMRKDSTTAAKKTAA